MNGKIIIIIIIITIIIIIIIIIIQRPFNVIYFYFIYLPQKNEIKIQIWTIKKEKTERK